MSSLLPIAAATALAVAGVIAKSQRGSQAISREELERLVQLRKAGGQKRATKPDQRGPAQVQAVEDRRAAIALALRAAAPADLVLIAGKGHEETQEIAGARQPFSDTEEALRGLRLRAGMEGRP